MGHKGSLLPCPDVSGLFQLPVMIGGGHIQY